MSEARTEREKENHDLTLKGIEDERLSVDEYPSELLVRVHWYAMSVQNGRREKKVASIKFLMVHARRYKALHMPLVCKPW